MECIDWNQTDTRINAICQITCSIWVFLLPLVGLPLILLSIISYNSPSCVKTWPIHRCFLFQIEFSSCLSSFTILRTSSVVTLSSQLIFSILLAVTFQRLQIFCLSASNYCRIHWDTYSRPSISLFSSLVPDSFY